MWLCRDLKTDVDDDTKYIALPNWNDLDLGKRVSLSFAVEQLANDYERACNFFNRRGAYGRFEVLLKEGQLLDKWYAYQEESTDRALQQWCGDNQIALAD